MRFFEILQESVQRRVPRMWLTPTGEAIDVGDTMHDRYVQANLADFGLDLEDFRNPAGGVDRMALVSAALEKGWVRISHDLRGYMHDKVSLSASSLEGLRRGVQWLHRNSYYPPAIEIEIDTLGPDKRTQHSGFTTLQGEDIDRFLKTGRVPRKIAEEISPILIPAIKVGGKVYKAPPGETHSYITWSMLSREEKEAMKTQHENPFVFIDHRGRVISRERAVDYALDNDLVQPQYRDMLEKCRGGTGGLAADFLRGYGRDRPQG